MKKIQVSIIDEERNVVFCEYFDSNCNKTVPEIIGDIDVLKGSVECLVALLEVGDVITDVVFCKSVTLDNINVPLCDWVVR